MVHPAHVMRIEPFTHADRYNGFFRMISAIPTAQHSRDDDQHRQTHYKANHRLSHGRLLITSRHAYILGHAVRKASVAAPARARKKAQATKLGKSSGMNPLEEVRIRDF
jgi:hypothetical protein